MNKVEMLTNRKELLKQVELTVDAELDGIVSDALRYELIRRLSDKVCESFPVASCMNTPNYLKLLQLDEWLTMGEVQGFIHECEAYQQLDEACAYEGTTVAKLREWKRAGAAEAHSW